MGDPGAAPKRIQLSRKKGYKKPAGAITVDRRTVWGNPYTVADGGREWAVQQFRRDWLACLGCDDDIRARLGYPDDAEVIDIIRAELRGHDLACWCPLDGGPCHADVLLELANADVPRPTSSEPRIPSDLRSFDDA